MNPENGMKRWALVVMCAVALATGAAGEGRAPNPTFDTVRPDLPADLKRPAILLFSKANGWQHDSRTAAAALVFRLAGKHGWAVYATENGAIFDPAQLERFDVVVLNSTTGDLFTPEQREAFKSWVLNGGRVVALHGAGGTNDQPWTWYTDTLIGGRFIGHPPIQPATIRVEDPKNPLMRGVPRVWAWRDEWYSFDRNPRGADTHVLASVDEATYEPTEKLRMKDHPVIWTRCVGQGGVFFSAIGHTSEGYGDPVEMSLIDGALGWAFDRHARAC